MDHRHHHHHQYGNMAPAQQHSFHGMGGKPQDDSDNNNNYFQSNNYNNSYGVSTSPGTSSGGEGVGGGDFRQFNAAIQVKTGASVNESMNFPFMGKLGQNSQQQQQQQQPEELKNNITRSSSHPMMMMNTHMVMKNSNESMKSSDDMWMNTTMDFDDGDEPLSFNLDHPDPLEGLLEDLMFDVNDDKRSGKFRGNQRSHSEPTLSLLADVFDAIDSEFDENFQLESTGGGDGWASPPPSVFDKVAPPKSNRNGRSGGGITGIDFGVQPSRKRSSSEPFMINDFMNDLQHLEPDTVFYAPTGGDSNSATQTFRSATAPPEWREFEQEYPRKAKRGTSFTLGQVMFPDQQQNDDNFLFGQSTPFTSSTSFLTPANPPPVQQAGNNSAFNDFSLALCAVQETQTNLRALQPLIMQLGNLAAMEELSIASKLTATSSQYILTSDLTNVYACLNDAWERMNKLEGLCSTSMTGRQQELPQQHTQQSGGRNDLSELQMMLTHGGAVAPSPGGGVVNYPSPLGNVTPHCPPLPPLNPVPNNDHAFAQFAMASSNENDRIRQSQPTSEVGTSATPRSEPIMVSTMSPLPKQENKQSSIMKAPSSSPSPTTIPSPGKNETLKDLPPASNTDPEIIMKRLQALMERTQMSQKRLQKWDRKNGLPKSHSQTMVNSSRSRKQLQKGVILKKWNGDPLISTEANNNGSGPNTPISAESSSLQC